MAFRKDTVKRQFAEAEAAVLEPGEQTQAGGFTTTGPSPWLAAGIGVIFMLLLGMRYYFVVVTDRRVLFMRSSMMSGRPKGLAFAHPRGQVSISDVKLAKLYSSLKYHGPDGKTLRLNFHRYWRNEMEGIVAALSAGPPAAG